MNAKYLEIRRSGMFSRIRDNDSKTTLCEVYGETPDQGYERAMHIMRALVAYEPMTDMLDTVARLARDREPLDRRDENMVQGVLSLALGHGNPPYPEFCRHKDQCAGRSSCPCIPTCAD